MKSYNLSLNGWLNINKPINYTSAKIVAIIKRITQAKKVGHGGTLDPLASGVLPICVNKATKQVEFMMNHEKIYEFSITFGESRDTCDGEGNVEESNDFIPNEGVIAQNINKFIGEIEQLPPKYSALKINGKRAYELARKGYTIEMKPRKIKINKLEFYGFKSDNTAEFRVECGRGCYIRSLAVDIAKSVDAIGYVSKLTRTKVGNFDLKNSLNIENINYDLIEKNIISI